MPLPPAAHNHPTEPRYEKTPPLPKNLPGRGPWLAGLQRADFGSAAVHGMLYGRKRAGGGVGHIPACHAVLDAFRVGGLAAGGSAGGCLSEREVCLAAAGICLDIGGRCGRGCHCTASMLSHTWLDWSGCDRGAGLFASRCRMRCPRCGLFGGSGSVCISEARRFGSNKHTSC